MTVVLDRIAPDPVEVPQLSHKVQVPEHSRSAHQKRLLKAHQVLSELSEENREEFAAVVEALRRSERPAGES
jgi:hypothetical protein